MSWNEILDRPFFLRLSLSLLHFLWQGAAAAGIFAAGDAVLRRRRAGSRARYGLACTALAAMAILPVVTFDRARSLAAPDAVASRSSASYGPSAPSAASALVPSTDTTLLSGFAGRLANGTAGAQPILLDAWMLGVAVLSIRLLAGWRIAGRFATRATGPARAELSASFDRLARRLALTRPVRLLESASIHVPTALGVLRPVVLVPVSALTGLDPTQLEALLAHELAHVRRHDYLVNLLQSAVETLLFYHPAVWWVSGRIRRERENCCDDLAVAVTGDARAYAGALVRLEERRGAGSAALVVASNGGDLFRRIARLVGAPESAGEAPSPRIVGAVTLAALLFLGAAARVSTLEATTARPFSREADSGVFPAPEGVTAAADGTAVAPRPESDRPTLLLA